VRAAGAPFDEARLYRVATVRDLLTGMDHISPFAEWHAKEPAAVPPPRQWP
jgi:hypothetical protein